MKKGELTDQLIWDALAAYAGCPFRTSRGLTFTYSVKGWEIFVDRKEKSITRATVRYFVRRVLELQAEGQAITGPKKVGAFGASYLLPVFRKIGLLETQNLKETED